MSRNADFDSFSRPRPMVIGIRPRCLFVGDPISLRRARAHLPVGFAMEHCQIYDVVTAIRQVRKPDIVLSFAITPLFDCLELAQILRLDGFAGRQRIIGHTLPAPDMICREVRIACPGLDFGVLDLAELRAR